ncbi:uncharacterized protein LOC124440711 [Xenia sp. Carnegie-2017]|uniref:uncharacterized protein LOC124440711 n=1 Tax=Xenia sp. Carnegie-2017 TaxID=2897299 RepID=UPI001F03E8D6|nr:uncharacterized protein LOC124440711 [Xenia sp. Carnegie-2017]
MKELVIQVSGLFIDAFLQYPVSCSLAFCIALYILYPVYYKDTEATKGLRWIVSCFAIFILLSVASIFFVPQFRMATDRIIFRPTPSCSTFDNPARYICLTFNEKHQQVFYTTTWRKCSRSDENMQNASNYYITSSWIPSFDHFVTRERMLFQPEHTQDEVKNPYYLPENYCVRAAGPSDGERVKVAFYSIKGTDLHLLDSGYINSSILKEFHSGWYQVSNCRSDLSRWMFDCSNGYVSSNYVRLPQYTRILLLEQRSKLEK